MNACRWGVTAALVAVSLALGATPASAASTQEVLFKAASGNQQGLATDGHYAWVSYDVGSGKSKIVTYTLNGTHIGTSGLLSLGHAAELDYRVKNGHLYVANGGRQTQADGSPTKVFEVSLTSNHIASSIVKTYDYTFLGYNGMVAIDNTTDTLEIIGGHDGGPWKVVRMPFSTGVNSSAVVIRDSNILLQGIGVIKGALWLYVSRTDTTSTSNSRMDVFNLTTGVSTSRTTLSFSGEAEGMSVNPITGSIYVGAHSVNRVMRLHLA